jgi:hypothetical protein
MTRDESELRTRLLPALLEQVPASLSIRDGQVDDDAQRTTREVRKGEGFWQHGDLREADAGAVQVSLLRVVTGAEELTFVFRADWRRSVVDFSVVLRSTTVSAVTSNYSHDPTINESDLISEAAADIWAFLMERLAHQSVQDLARNATVTF